MPKLIETTVGLPNTCSSCGGDPGPTWFAIHEDEARAGGGKCRKCAHAGESAAASSEGDKDQQPDNAQQSSGESKADSSQTGESAPDKAQQPNDEGKAPAGESAAASSEPKKKG